MSTAGWAGILARKGCSNVAQSLVTSTAINLAELGFGIYENMETQHAILFT